MSKAKSTMNGRVAPSPRPNGDEVNNSYIPKRKLFSKLKIFKIANKRGTRGSAQKKLERTFPDRLR